MTAVVTMKSLSTGGVNIIARELALDLSTNKKRLKKIIRTWLGTGVLVKKEALGPQRKMVPVVDVGEWITQ